MADFSTLGKVEQERQEDRGKKRKTTEEATEEKPYELTISEKSGLSKHDSKKKQQREYDECKCRE